MTVRYEILGKRVFKNLMPLKIDSKNVDVLKIVFGD